MRLNVNQKTIDLLNGQSLVDLAMQLQLPRAGMAMAVNGTIVHMDEWDSFVLSENDHITVIQATRGG
ncbi:MAG: sulfur carrier protein ThiS [Breznakibacter sp.]